MEPEDSTGYVRLLSDLTLSNLAFLQPLFEREQSPEGYVDDAALWTVLKETGQEYGMNLSPVVKQMKEMQRKEVGGKKLQMAFPDLLELLKSHCQSLAQTGSSQVSDENRPKSPQKSLPKTRPQPASLRLKKSGPVSKSALSPSPFYSPTPNRELDQQLTKSSSQIILETRLLERNLSNTQKLLPRIPNSKKSVASPSLKLDLGIEPIKVEEKNTADRVLADWKTRLEELKAKYESEGPILALEWITKESNIAWNPAFQSDFEGMMTRKKESIPEESTEPIDSFDSVFWPCLQGWVSQHPDLRKSGKSATELMVEKLKNTIMDIEGIERTQKLTGQDTTYSEQLLQTLRSQVQTIEKSQKEEETGDSGFAERCKTGIHETYLFYAKQMKMIGKVPSFDEIQHSSTILSSGKFLKFLRDFQLLEAKKLSSRKVIDRTTAATIFKRSATLQKEMNEPQFSLALDLVAMAYFDSEFDEINATEYAKMPLPAKREKLYRILGMDTPESYREKMKGFGVPFSTYTDYRIPEDDPARNYKYREYKHQRMTIDEWKNRVQRKVSSDSSIPQAHTSNHFLSKPKKAPNKSKGIPLAALLRDSDSSDFDLNDLIGGDADDSEDEKDGKKQLTQIKKSNPSLPPHRSPRLSEITKSAKQAMSLPPGRAEILTNKAGEMQKIGLSKDAEAVSRALKSMNAQLEKGQKAAQRVEAAASKYKT